MKKYIILILLSFAFFTMANTQSFEEISLENLIGQFDEKKDSEFISLDSTMLLVNKSGMYLQKEPAQQLIKAYKDFKQQHPNIPFIVVSATRNYTYQNGIWQRKWNATYPQFKNDQKTAENILKFSSMPGTSRHHWGTDIDITSLSSDYFKNDKKGKILNQWLQNNMSRYGFCQPYNEGRKGGYQPEEWHWSYKPIAKEYLAHYQSILEENEPLIINKLDFIGHDKIQLRKMIREFVLDVNPDCY